MTSKPKTIEELQQWYEDRNLPPYETTRFFIGENYLGARAFGIYKEGDFVTVYKNKNDGTRAIRYTGTDEEYAVNELFLRLKAEIENQKRHNGKTMGKKAKKSFDNIFSVALLSILAFIFAIFGAESCKNNKKKGYYEYENRIYYFYSGSWYLYDDIASDYRKVTVSSELDKNYKNYAAKDDSYYSSSYYDFYDSAMYEEIRSREESDYDDSDYDWDSGDSWDSGGTDFDSDW